MIRYPFQKLIKWWWWGDYLNQKWNFLPYCFPGFFLTHLNRKFKWASLITFLITFWTSFLEPLAKFNQLSVKHSYGNVILNEGVNFISKGDNYKLVKIRNWCLKTNAQKMPILTSKLQCIVNMTPDHYWGHV